MKKLVQSIMAVPIAERIGKAFGRRSFLAAGAELVTARLVLRSFGAMLALGALAGGISWLAGKKHETGERADGGDPADDAPRAKGKSRKSAKASAA